MGGPMLPSEAPIANPSDPREVAIHCAEIACEKRARDIIVFDVLETIRLAHYFVIASGTGPRQLRTIADLVDRKLRRAGVTRLGIEGYDAGRWILLDFCDVVVHLLLEEARDYYDLELLWGDCPRVAWTPPELPEEEDEEGLL